MKKSELSENQNPEPVKGKNKNSSQKRLPASLRGFVSLTVCAAAVITVSGGLRLQTVFMTRAEFMQRQRAQEVLCMKVRVMNCHPGLLEWHPV